MKKAIDFQIKEVPKSKNKLEKIIRIRTILDTQSKISPQKKTNNKKEQKAIL